MLSRLAFRNTQALSVAVRGIQSSAPALSDVPRQKRPVHPSPVRHGFIPEEWFTFFYPKTGVTGPYVFLTGVSTYLLSKELYILDHEFYNSISLFSIIIFANYKFGPKIGAYLDQKSKEYIDAYSTGRRCELEGAEQAIKELETEKWRAEAQALIIDARKQNIAMSLEAVYRERLMKLYVEVKKRLDYNAQIDIVERRIAQKHMVQWILSNVLKAITPEQEKANLQQCIKDLESLAAKA
ncbi:ATP synthase subunit b, mitochondrial [Lasioglossum baleicum]|uniref:ATP synthase subunit b, mitochondrial n=1 Tax=Lasioglossum baleicum TaxID=434251 RepID=UPI003FCD9F37